MSIRDYLGLGIEGMGSGPAMVSGAVVMRVLHSVFHPDVVKLVAARVEAALADCGERWAVDSVMEVRQGWVVISPWDQLRWLSTRMVGGS